jgi:hypothetical protein
MLSVLNQNRMRFSCIIARFPSIRSIEKSLMDVELLCTAGFVLKSRPKHDEHLCGGRPEMSICLDVMP